MKELNTQFEASRTGAKHTGPSTELETEPEIQVNRGVADLRETGPEIQYDVSMDEMQGTGERVDLNTDLEEPFSDADMQEENERKQVLSDTPMADLKKTGPAIQYDVSLDDMQGTGQEVYLDTDLEEQFDTDMQEKTELERVLSDFPVDDL